LNFIWFENFGGQRHKSSKNQLATDLAVQGSGGVSIFEKHQSFDSYESFYVL